MKYITAILVAFVTLFGTEAKAQNFDFDFDDVDIVGNFGVYNQYLAFGSAAVLYENPVSQASLRATFKNGIFVELWHSVSLDDFYGDSLGNELDFILGWNGSIGEWNISTQAAIFDSPSILDFSAGDIWYGKFDISRDLELATVGLDTRVYIPFRNSPFDGGWLIGPYISKNFDITDRLSVFTKFSANYDDGAFGFENGWILENYTGVSYELTDKVTWNALQFTGYVPLAGDIRESDVVIGTGFSIILK